MSGDGERRGWAERVEAVARIVPGVAGYQDREGLREADKRVRLYLAEQLAGVSRILERVQRALVDAKRLGELPAVDRLVRQCATAADRIRTARYGFAGVFDLAKVREQQLSALHEYDLGLLAAIPGLRERADALGQQVTPEALKAAEESLTRFEAALDERDHLAQQL